MQTLGPMPEDTVAVFLEDEDGEFQSDSAVRDNLAAWQIEATAVDRSMQILPGMKDLIDSIPAGRYAVATSGAKTYAYGCMTRVGISPPPVTVTNDKRLKAGKPAPDPFLLAADCLGLDAKRCVRRREVGRMARDLLLAVAEGGKVISGARQGSASSRQWSASTILGCSRSRSLTVCARSVVVSALPGPDPVPPPLPPTS